MNFFTFFVKNLFCFVWNLEIPLNVLQVQSLAIYPVEIHQSPCSKILRSGDTVKCAPSSESSNLSTQTKFTNPQCSKILLSYRG